MKANPPSPSQQRLYLHDETLVVSSQLAPLNLALDQLGVTHRLAAEILPHIKKELHYVGETINSRFPL